MSAWLDKVSSNIFEGVKINRLRRLPGGDAYVIILQRCCSTASQMDLYVKAKAIVSLLMRSARNMKCLSWQSQFCANCV